MDEVEFDREATLARLGVPAEFLREIAGLFIEDCPRLMEDVRAAVARQDAASLAEAAHALKGTVMNFSTAGALKTLTILERTARQGDLSSSVPLLAVLEGQMERLTVALAAVAAPPD